MRTVALLRKTSKRIRLRTALVCAQVVLQAQALMAQATPNADVEGINGWVIGIALLALLVLSWASWQLVAKRRAAKEARLAEERRAIDEKLLASERRAQEEARLAAMRREEEARRAEKRRAERENWARALPHRLQAAINVPRERMPEDVLKVVFQGHPDFPQILICAEAATGTPPQDATETMVPLLPPKLLDEVISDLRKGQEEAKALGMTNVVKPLEGLLERLRLSRVCLSEAQQDFLTRLRSGAPSQSSSSPIRR
jgi:hypothetical protein